MLFINRDIHKLQYNIKKFQNVIYNQDVNYFLV